MSLNRLRSRRGMSVTELGAGSVPIQPGPEAGAGPSGVGGRQGGGRGRCCGLGLMARCPGDPAEKQKQQWGEQPMDGSSRGQLKEQGSPGSPCLHPEQSS